MGQVITNAFEQYWQSSLAAEQPVVLDEFVLADIPNLDITAPIDPDTGLPPAGQIVYRQTVDQRGRVNSNAVAYSIVMDTTVGDFSFNAMFLRNKANGVIGMIVYKGRETKLKTDQTTGQTGNSLVKSMLMGYDQAAEATLTNVDAGTWQIDYAARLRGQDEDLRQLASQLYGHHTFIGDGFKVVQQDGGHQVTQGVAIVGGLRIELKQPEVIYPGTKPIGVWVDVHRAGSLLSEYQNHFTIITSVADLTDHVDGNGYQHYVAKLGTVQADNTVVDGRGQGGSGGSGVSVEDFGASPTASSVVNTAAFQKAEERASGGPIHVPEGVFQLTTPRDLGPDGYYFGPGKLRFDKAEVWRKGGSAGSSSERYTIPYEWDDISQMRVTINDVSQDITLFQPRTVEAPPSTPSDTVKIWAINGTFQLGTVPVSPLSLNSPDGARNLDGYVPYQPGGNTPRPQGNTFVGPSAGEQMLDGNGNIMIGQAAGLSAVTGDGNILMGPQSLYRAMSPYRNVMIGNVTGELATGTCSDNTAVGHAAMGKLGANTAGNTAVGSSALGDAGPTSYAVAVGYRAAGNGVELDQYGSIAIGAFCMSSNRAPYNLGIGYRALGGGGGPGVTGTRNVAIGHSSLLDATSAHDNVLLGTDTGHAGTTFNYCVAVGTSALFSNIGVSELTAVGHESLYSNDGGLRNTGLGSYSLRFNVSGNDNTAIGWSGQKTTTGSGNTSVGSRTQEQATTGGNNTTVGFESARNLTTGSANTLIGTRAGREIGANNDNVALGSDALQVLTSGNTNTAIGRSSLRFMQDTTNATTLTNCTGVGANSSVSGNNQVQIGDSATTTYVYGTVQNRSDERDKAELRPTTLGDEFIDGLEAEEGFWDMRDDYLEEHQVQVGIDLETAEPIFETRFRHLPKDGSKKRNRRHQWFRAQKIKALCEKLGIDFGGFQDHTVNGGCDVMSLGYDEFIPPLTAYVQRRKTELRALEKLVTAQQKAIELLTERLSALEIK
ncbi:phage tail protein [Aeromonas sobria]|uniref:phage tail-collar fiber domain-containing protein n=1 Tax=Aeromonas sobria TaxID=646 RepID=UPI003D070CAC